MVDKDKIEKILHQKFKVGNNFSISDEGLVSVDGNCVLQVKTDEMPVAFDRIGGSFYCTDSGLTSTKGFPREVGLNFDCSSCRLTSCEGMPHSVGMDFWCNNNMISSLVGLPRTIHGRLSLRGNNLVSLVGAPIEIGGPLVVRGNPLVSLDGLPAKIGLVVLHWQPDLPLLRLVSTSEFLFASSQSGNQHSIVSEIINKWIKAEGSLRSRIVGCQNELIANGFEGNAKW